MLYRTITRLTFADLDQTRTGYRTAGCCSYWHQALKV